MPVSRVRHSRRRLPRRCQLALLAALIPAVGGVVSCAPAPTPPMPGQHVGFATTEALATYLTEAGLRLADLGEASYAWFDAPGHTYEIGSEGLEVLFVHEYPDAAAARAAARRISPDARRVISTEGTEILVEWLGEPHAFLSGPLLVVYVGTNVDTLRILGDALGSPFAGPSATASP